MLIQTLPTGQALDEEHTAGDRHWKASPQARFERLLRETHVPLGLLVNGLQLRLAYAPHGESAGHLTFPVRAMVEVPGRPILAALHMLLRSERLFTNPEKQRLPAILVASRKYQSTVSTRLAGQVLAALFDLLRGFQAADDRRKGELLRQVLAENPNDVYAGLLTVLMRLVFLLYAEDRGLMSGDAVYVNHYAVTGLFERLRADAGRYPDTMDQRYGAWAQLLALFRIVHDGAKHKGLDLPAPKGYLFDPDRYPFLEGRPPRSQRVTGERLNVPMVPDGVVYRVLDNLLILDGERLSYRTLDVEQIGSVYEAMMGFRLEKATGPSIAVKAHGAPVTVNLADLLALAPEQRGKRLKEQTDQSLPPASLNALKAAKTPEDAVAALERKVARAVTPNIVAAGSMILQPSDERRRSGSHYTPRSLTEPIVRKALEPVLKQLGEQPRPEADLGLKVCDPAMGSGAFLVEACRQLGAVLLKAWTRHGRMPRVPDDETPELFAQRMIAQRCLYGVDKNPMATDLAKLSLWLATLAKSHSFTFLDHALRCGDSLVGLTKQQIVRFHWKDGPQQNVLGQDRVTEALLVATRMRQEIINAGDEMPFQLKQTNLATADGTLNLVRFAGNLAVVAFFGADKDKKRQERRDELLAQLTEYLRTGNMNLRPTVAEKALRDGPKGITPFHWEIEFPEVFNRDNPGFDCIVGNPPFAGKNTIIEGHADGYLDWLKAVHAKSHGNADLVAHFYRRVFNLLRERGTFGLIATNTIAQGDTRTTGLRWICTHGGTIYAARRRYKWPGQAAVVVSAIHVAKGEIPGLYELDGKPEPLITAYLFHAGGHENPATLKANADKSFQGSIVLGMGFTFDDTEKDGTSSPISLMHELIAKDKRNSERIFPYIGGEEINSSSTQAHQRYAIDFGELPEEEARAWPDLMRIVEERVKPERMRQNDRGGREKWWQFLRPRRELREAIIHLDRVLVISRIGNAFAFVFIPARQVINEKVVLFPFDSYPHFATLQSRPHEVWTRFFSSTLKDDLQYTPSDCFETFAFPEGFETDPRLEQNGRDYYEYRAALMFKNDQGLTKTYNRFHDPNERSPDIVKLRELHAELDRAVLDAYDWTDLKPRCEFLLDYEEEDEEETGGKPKKKPWRYRWPDEFRDEVLARLLELNKQRAEAEKLSGTASEKKKGAQGDKKGGKKKAKDDDGPRLFGAGTD